VLCREGIAYIKKGIIMSRAEELRAELKRIEQEEAAEKTARKAATPVVRKFTIKPVTNRWTVMYDSTCVLYDLSAEVTNADEAKAAGHYEHDMRGGGMTYVFNTGTGRIVCSTGGGTIWIGGGFAGQNDESAAWTMIQISAFIVQHPEGGDITAIVEAHRNKHVG
jgi:hypothetical protein